MRRQLRFRHREIASGEGSRRDGGLRSRFRRSRRQQLHARLPAAAVESNLSRLAQVNWEGENIGQAIVDEAR